MEWIYPGSFSEKHEAISAKWIKGIGNFIVNMIEFKWFDSACNLLICPRIGILKLRTLMMKSELVNPF